MLSVGHQETWRTNVHSLAVSVSELELSEQNSTHHDDVRRKKTANGLSVTECTDFTKAVLLSRFCTVSRYTCKRNKVCDIYIQGVTGGKDQTSGGCSLR